MKSITFRIAALLLAALLALSGCGTMGSDTGWVYRHNNQDISAGMYISYQIAAVGEAMTKLSEANAGQTGYTLPATVKDLLKTTVEDKPAAQWLQEKTDSYAKLYFAVEEKFAQLGREVTPYMQSAADYSTESMWANSSQLFEKNGISKASLAARSLNDAKLQDIFLSLYGEGGERAVPEEDLKAAFVKDYAEVEVFTASKPTEVPEGSTKTVEQLAADMKASFESYVPRMEKGEAIEDIAYEFDLAQAKAAGQDESAVQKDPHESFLLFIDKAESAYYRKDFLEKVMAAEVGKVEMFELENAFFIIRKQDILADEHSHFDQYEGVILGEMKFDEFEDEMLQQATGLDVQQNAKALSRYKVEKVDLSTIPSAS